MRKDNEVRDGRFEKKVGGMDSLRVPGPRQRYSPRRRQRKDILLMLESVFVVREKISTATT